VLLPEFDLQDMTLPKYGGVGLGYRTKIFWPGVPIPDSRKQFRIDGTH